MLSITDLFKIGRGPSSSHTIGPMRACAYVLKKHDKKDIDFITVIFYGSLALTGKRHLSDRAVDEIFADIKHEIKWDVKGTQSTFHPNTMDIILYKNEAEIKRYRVTSFGGGTIFISGEKPQKDIYPFHDFKEIKTYIKENHLSFYEFLCKFEDRKIVDNLFDEMKQVIHSTIEIGLSKSGSIPGIADFDYRGSVIYKNKQPNETDIQRRIRLVSAYAYATNEEAVNYGMVITAPTCGSAGTLPSVFKYLTEELKSSDERIKEALSAASIIGITVKQNGSVSGAENGCQAEIGVACAMAAAMASSLLYNSDINEMERAASLALQQSLGLTCDAVGQAVYVPCIQRNAIYAIRAIEAAEMAHLLVNDPYQVDLDTMIRTVLETGNDLPSGYRETSLEGLSKWAKYSVKLRN